MSIRHSAFSSIVALVPMFALACGSSSPPPAESPQGASDTTSSSAGNAAAPPNSDTATKGSDNTGTSTGVTSMGSTTTTTGSNTAMGGSSTTMGGSGTATGSPSTLSDSEILQVTHVANMGEVEQARLAQQKAKDARVKRFAAMMVKEHSEADAKGNELAKQNALSPSESNTSAMLKSDSESTVQQLKLSNADFDRTYMDAQVKAHRTVLDTIDTKLLPSAKSPDLRTMLQSVRAKVEGHLREAQDIQRSLTTK
ncbi:DUF4142 domain-containing protein [Pendulispora albinea]|uniref:DUF4142 domain-containing protein n=1 Tax=Pendulispora albinea TaxID=2741071 RepID=A0ABZ2LR30_9BACT